MRCPVCGSELVLGEGKRAYQTLEEHIYYDPCAPDDEKDYLICSNTACRVHDIVFWDEYGDFYANGDIFDLREKYINLYPLGSRRLQTFIENEKADENFTLLNLFFIRWRIVYKYKADMDGNILSRSIKVETHLRKNCGWALRISSYQMLKFTIEWFEMVFNRYCNNPDSRTVRKELISEYQKISESKALYKKVAYFWINNKYGNVMKIVRVEELFSK